MGNLVIGLDSHYGIDGVEQIFSSRQTSKVSTTLYQEENHDHDCGGMDLLCLLSFVLHPWWEKNSVPSFQVFLLSSAV